MVIVEVFFLSLVEVNQAIISLVVLVDCFEICVETDRRTDRQTDPDTDFKMVRGRTIKKVCLI